MVKSTIIRHLNLVLARNIDSKSEEFPILSDEEISRLKGSPGLLDQIYSDIIGVEQKNLPVQNVAMSLPQFSQVKPVLVEDVLPSLQPDPVFESIPQRASHNTIVALRRELERTLRVAKRFISENSLRDDFVQGAFVNQANALSGRLRREGKLPRVMVCAQAKKFEKKLDHLFLQYNGLMTDVVTINDNSKEIRDGGLLGAVVIIERKQEKDEKLLANFNAVKGALHTQSGSGKNFRLGEKNGVVMLKGFGGYNRVRRNKARVKSINVQRHNLTKGNR